MKLYRAIFFLCFWLPVTVMAQGTNLALNKTASASGIEGNSYEATRAFDGILSTRWSGTLNNNDNQWIAVDLGRTYALTRVVLRWEIAYGSQYKIQVSDNGSSWTDAYTETRGDGGVDEITFTRPINARYVRMLGIKRATEYSYSLYEFEVYGSTNVNSSVSSQSRSSVSASSAPSVGVSTTNIAFKKATVGSSTFDQKYPAGNATDANPRSKWMSAVANGDNATLRIDLRVPTDIRRIVINWAAEYAVDYSVRVSPDAKNWTVIYKASNAKGGIDTIETDVRTRYVQFLGGKRLSQYKVYGINEFEIYGPGAITSPPVTQPPPSSSGTHSFSWEVPTERENGERLPVNEIGGYEIRGKRSDGTVVYREQINNGRATTFSGVIANASQIAVFEIAVFDTEGLFSEYVRITPRAPTTTALPAPTGLRIRD